MVLKISFPNYPQLNLRMLMDMSRTSVQFNSKISIRKGRVAADPKSFIEMVALLDATGHDLEIAAEGEDSYSAVQALHSLAAGSPA